MIPLEQHQFMKKIMSDNAIEEADGRPIYQYNLSTDDCVTLHHVLATGSEDTEHPNWCALFMMYAVESWHHEYSGGNWEWEAIFKSINKQHLNKPSLREDIMALAFGFWKRPMPTMTKNRHTFLASHIAECGIPNYLLEQECGISNLISKTIDRTSHHTTNQKSSIEVVEELVQKLIPESLQHPAFYALIAEIAAKLILIKQKYPEINTKEPVSFMDKKVSEWRTNFPIKADHDMAKTFMDGLLTDVSKKAPVTPLGIAFNYSLNSDLKSIRTSLSFSNTLVDHKSIGLERDEFEALSQCLNISLHNTDADTYQTIAYAYRKGSDKLYLSAKEQSLNLPAGAEMQSWELTLFDPEQQVHHSIARTSSPFDNSNAPWIFANVEDKWVYQASGSVSLAQKKCLVVCQKEYSSDIKLRTLKKFDKEKIILTISKSATVSTNDDEIRIELGQKTVDANTYQLIGQHHPLIYKNDTTFVGPPHLIRIDEHNIVHHMAQERLTFKPNMYGKWLNITSRHAIGKGTVKLLAKDGTLLFSQQITLLPADFSIDINAKGDLDLTGTSAFQVGLESEDALSGYISKMSLGHCIHLHNDDDENKNELIHIKLHNVNVSKTTLTITCPKKSYSFYNADGQVITQAHIDYGQILGCKIGFFNESSEEEQIDLSFELIDCEADAPVAIRKTIKISPYYSQKSLMDFEHIIDHLFSQGGPEAKVCIAHKDDVLSINRASQGASYDRDLKVFNIDNEDIDKSAVKVGVFRVDSEMTEESFIPLPYKAKQACWPLPSEVLEAGNWMVYPMADSHLMFRPFLIANEEESEGVEEINSLKEVATVSLQALRIKLIKDLIDRCAGEVDHPVWQEVTSLWQASKHLAVTTFDLWAAMAQSPRGMIHLLLNMPDELSRKLENSFFIAWHSFGIEDYKQVLDLSAKNTSEELTPSSLKTTLLDHIECRLDLDILCTLLQDQKLDPVPAFLIAMLQQDEICGKENQTGLIGRHISKQYPGQLNSAIKKAFKSLPAEVKSCFPKLMHQHTAGVIYLPALLAYESVFGQHFHFLRNQDNNIHLKEIIDFDTTWHHTSFNFMQGICYFLHPAQQQ